MRVVAGSARGRRLVAPAGDRTRPTSDRVREATFNALGSLGAVDGAAVLDLFAGSGALGIEALSRGADSATFVDDDAAAIRAVRANLDTCRLDDRAEVVHAPADRFLARATGRRWDLGLLDPPYRFDGWPELLAGLPCDLAVIESGEELSLPEEWELLRSRRYGAAVVQIARRGARDGER